MRLRSDIWVAAYLRRCGSADVAAFLRRRGAIELVHVVAAQRGVADQGCHVDGGLGGIDGCGIVGETRIAEGGGFPQQVHRVWRIAVQAHRGGADAAIAGDHG